MMNEWLSVDHLSQELSSLEDRPSNSVSQIESWNILHIPKCDDLKNCPLADTEGFLLAKLET